MNIKVYHTQARKAKVLTFPELGEGEEQWLGDGFYFWQDFDFAEWWGDTKKCKKWNLSRQYDIYITELEYNENEILDTVFNEEDYYNFVKRIEKWAKAYQKRYKDKPTLEEFNLFISEFKIWEDIKLIRFQDVPVNNTLVEVNGFYYKKRIQLMVNHPEIISKFEHYKTKDCLTS